MVPFGPQLIGQTEKALNALLLHVIADDQLTEHEWVALRLAAQNGGAGGLSEFIREVAHVVDSDAVVTELAERGLVRAGQVTNAGQEVLDRLGTRIAELTAPIWAGIDSDDRTATEQVLNTVLSRTTEILVGTAVSRFT